jgi:hypothetical protein
LGLFLCIAAGEARRHPVFLLRGKTASGAGGILFQQLKR